MGQTPLPNTKWVKQTKEWIVVLLYNCSSSLLPTSLRLASLIPWSSLSWRIGRNHLRSFRLRWLRSVWMLRWHLRSSTTKRGQSEKLFSLGCQSRPWVHRTCAKWWVNQPINRNNHAVHYILELTVLWFSVQYFFRWSYVYRFNLYSFSLYLNIPLFSVAHTRR